MENIVVTGIAFVIVIAVGSVLYNYVSNKIELNWSKLIGAYVFAILLLVVAQSLESPIIMYFGIILIAILGFISYGKMFNKN